MGRGRRTEEQASEALGLAGPRDRDRLGRMVWGVSGDADIRTDWKDSEMGNPCGDPGRKLLWMGDPMTLLST